MTTSQNKYRAVAFYPNGGERAVCGGRHFEAIRVNEGFDVSEIADGGNVPLFRAANLGEIRTGVESYVRQLAMVARP